MKKFFILTLVLSALLVFAGCTDNSALKEIQDTQQEILTSQKELLTKVTDIEKKITNIKTPPTRPTIDYNKVHNLPIGKSVVKGDKSAPVTVVEFSDFQCPYCSRLQPTLRDVLKAYPKEVKLVYKHFPLSFHKQAKNASKASEAAREQGKFWEMHDVIYENFNKLTEKSFDEFAIKLELDMEKFKADYASTKYDKMIQDDINLARKVGVTGTPSLFMNGKRMQRRSLDDFKQYIDKIIKK
jgi:protein-disulfide isomerase